MRCYLYLRTSEADRDTKAGIDVQRKQCNAHAKRAGLTVEQEFVDDDVTGTVPMHMRSAGAKLLSALLGDGVKTVLVYDAKRVGRTQPVFWRFIGDCRDIGVTVLDSSGNDIGTSVQGGVQGMLAEMDRDATVARLAAGKAHWRGTKRVDGRWPFGEHPSREFDAERVVVSRIQAMHTAGVSSYAIARTFNAEGTRTRYGKEFTTTTVLNILRRSLGKNYFRNVGDRV